ncbi:MAG: hypothetical protein KC643_11765 [Nitrospira sp.]|nr:hypothetical protein [Nitrospira sp.]
MNKMVLIAILLLIGVGPFTFKTWAKDIESFQAIRVDLSASETTLISRESAWLGLAYTQNTEKMESLEEVSLGDLLDIGDQPFHVETIEVTRFHKDASYGGESLGRKGEDVCSIWETAGPAPYLDDQNHGVGHRWLHIRNCKVLEFASPDIAGPMNLSEYPLRQYQTAVGVFPQEFLRFSREEQEFYIRGVMDGQYILGVMNKQSDLGTWVSCLNRGLAIILAQSRSFVESDGEEEFLMPWTLSRLVGKTCPKETREPSGEDVKYLVGTTAYMLSPENNFSEEDVNTLSDAIARTYVRGVLDGMVFFLHGRRFNKLPDFLKCLSQPNAFDNTVLYMRNMQTLKTENFDKTAAYDVTEGVVRIVCKGDLQ